MKTVGTSALPASVDTRAVLRTESAFDVAFLLQLAIALVVLVGGVSLWMRRFARSGPLLHSKAEKSRLVLLARLTLSTRSRVSLLQADGHKVLITESGPAVHVQVLPSCAASAAGGASGSQERV